MRYVWTRIFSQTEEKNLRFKTIRIRVDGDLKNDLYDKR